MFDRSRRSARTLGNGGTGGPQAQHETHGRALVVAAAVALLPALIAYRYTSPEQRDTFVRRPWRGWSFVVAALRVPGDSELKTSGQALRKADWLFEDTLIEPQERPTARHAHEPGVHGDGGRLSRPVTPSHRFIWEVRGTVPSSAR